MLDFLKRARLKQFTWNSRGAQGPDPDLSDLPISSNRETQRKASLVAATVDWVAAQGARVRVLDASGVLGERIPWKTLLYNGLWDFLIDGNAYYVPESGELGNTAGLRWTGAPVVLPHTTRGGGRPVGYTVWTDGESQQYAPEDIVHATYRPDPYHPWMGISPLDALLVELDVDREAAQATRWTLRRRGTPWAIFVPDKTVRPPSEAQRAQVEQWLNSAFQGDANRGKARTMPIPGELVYPSTGQPIEAIYPDLRNVSEERVTAVFHVAASVIGFGTGVQQTKVGATMEQARFLSWQDGVLPVVERLVHAISEHLGVELTLDTSHIEEMQPSRALQMQEVYDQLEKGLITFAEAQRRLNLPEDSSAEVYLIGGQMVPMGEVDEYAQNSPLFGADTGQDVGARGRSDDPFDTGSPEPVPPSGPPEAG